MKKSNRRDPIPSRRTARAPRRKKHQDLPAVQQACRKRIRWYRRKKHRLQIGEWVQENFAVAIRVAILRGSLNPEEAVQRGIVNGIKTFLPDAGRPLSSWLWLYVACSVCDELRQRYRDPCKVALDEQHVETLAAEDEPADDERLVCLRRILNLLPPDLVNCLLDHYGDETPQKEMVARLGCSLAALKMRLKRGRCSMAAMLRVIGCHSVSDVDALGEISYQRPIVVTWPRAFRPKSRPSCRPPGK